MAEQCEHYRELAMRATGNTQALRMSGTQRRSKVEDGVVHLVDLLEGIDAQAQQLRKWQDEAYAVIGAIDDTQAQELLELRYFNGLGWGEIAIRMHYEIAQIHRIHRRALEEAQKEIERRQAKKEIAAGY